MQQTKRLNQAFLGLNMLNCIVHQDVKKVKPFETILMKRKNTHIFQPNKSSQKKISKSKAFAKMQETEKQ